MAWALFRRISANGAFAPRSFVQEEGESSLHTILSSSDKSSLLSSDVLTSDATSDCSDSDSDSESSPALQKAVRHVRSSLSRTHAGVAQFTAEEGTVGLPYLAAKSLGLLQDGEVPDVETPGLPTDSFQVSSMHGSVSNWQLSDFARALASPAQG